MRYCDSPVRFCAVFAVPKQILAQNLTAESQYRSLDLGPLLGR